MNKLTTQFVNKCTSLFDQKNKIKKIKLEYLISFEIELELGLR